MPEVLGAAALLESLERELADRLQHPEALAGPADQALVDQRLQHVQIGGADRLGRFQGAAAGEHGQPGEQALLPRPRAGRGSRRSSPAASAAARARRAARP